MKSERPQWGKLRLTRHFHVLSSYLIQFRAVNEEIVHLATFGLYGAAAFTFAIKIK